MWIDRLSWEKVALVVYKAFGLRRIRVILSLCKADKAEFDGVKGRWEPGPVIAMSRKCTANGTEVLADGVIATKILDRIVRHVAISSRGESGASSSEGFRSWTAHPQNNRQIAGVKSRLPAQLLEKHLGKKVHFLPSVPQARYVNGVRGI